MRELSSVFNAYVGPAAVALDRTELASQKAMCASPEQTMWEEQVQAESLVQHMRFVWRVLRWMGVPSRDVEDATQRVFLIVVSKLDRVRPGSERAYLFSTAVSVARKLRRPCREVGGDPRWLDQPDPGLDPEATADHRQRIALLDQILDQMDDELREVFVLCEVEQLTMREVSGLLAVPPGTVASRLRRAREQLQTGVEKAKVVARSRRDR